MHKLNFLGHPTFLRDVVHCLVAESNLQVLTEWILATDSSQQPLPSLMVTSSQIGRARILKYTIQSQSYWTQNPLILEESVRTYDSFTRKARALDGVYIS
jgi:hypothetical protein